MTNTLNNTQQTDRADVSVRTDEAETHKTRKRIPDFEDCGSVAVIKPCCGGVVLIAVNHPSVLDADTKREIGDLVADGCRVEHWSRQDVKQKPWHMGCKCPKPVSEFLSLG